ncbi:MAG: PKD domain-containing protein [Bacteroidetes bacterium]|nr:MAG: PKD domain-containing protein [Bacteroidota bacterium]
MRLLTALFLLTGLALCQPAAAQQTYPVRFAHGTEFFPDNYQAIRQQPDVNPEELVNGYYFRFIQCTEIPTGRQRTVLEKAGLQFISYIQFGAYLVAIPEQFDLDQLATINTRSVVPVKPVWKMARNLQERPFGAWAVQGDLVDIYLQIYPQIRIEEGAALAAQYGLTVVKQGTQNGILQVRLLKDHLEAIAALPFVQYMELIPQPGEPEDDGGRSLHRSNMLDVDFPGGNKYDGTGVTVMVRDDGPLGPHIDFQGRNTDLFNPGDNANGTHGDGVGGVMAGAGNLNPVMRGMATGAKIFTIRYQADFQDNTMDLHYNENVTITNSSYSNGCNAGYTTITQTVEQQLQENPTLMHVFSAGNSNGLECDYGAGNQWGNITGGHKAAKNAIATANLFVDGTLVNSSSRGPLHDGRMKPDIAAHGQNQNSTTHDNDYQVFGGTSAAAPGIAGCLAQLTQAYKEMHGGTEPAAALLKTALLNTANDLGNEGPDFKFGWGHVNAWRAYQLLEKDQWLEGSVEQGATSTHSIQIPPGTRRAKIMLYWVERPANTNASRALLNDLDLTITDLDGSTIHLPWKLDPTPDPIILNTPAGKGRDSLNNTEQVVLDNPTPGTYTINVNGFEVPFGPQDYYIAWEFYNDDVKITYPAGGEGLVPGEITRIQWDAYGDNTNFTLRYSLDDGASFLPLTTLTGEKRMFEWATPNTVTSKLRLLLIRSNKRDTTDYPISIVGVPKNLTIDRVCPDSMTVSWAGVNDTLSYDVYALGQKYMEIVGQSDTSNLTFPIQNQGQPFWISVRASHADGLAGRRAVAINWEGGLKECPQPDDVALNQVLSPTDQDVSTTVSCTALTTDVKVRVANEGLNPISGAVINYQLNSAPVVTENLPDIAAGETLDYTFQQPVTIFQNGFNSVRIWSTYGDEDVLFNDTIVSSFVAVVSPENQFFQEGFQAPDFPPLGWSVENPDDQVTWARSGTVTGVNGQNTRTSLLNCFNYPERGAEDYIYLIPINLSGLPNPGLRFDVAHANYDDPQYRDSLRVDVFANCDLNANPVTIWGKAGEDLATTLATTSAFAPNDDQDWRTEGVSLNAFAGQTVIIRFASVNDFGNNIYLDNIGLIEYNVNPPVAEVVASADTICRLDTIIYNAVNVGILSEYSWVFGAGALPSYASGPGPHAIRYLSPGNKNVRLIVSNPAGIDTSFVSQAVLGPPATNFTWSANGPTVTFTNTTVNGQSYLWDFGDGNTSTEVSPEHTYAAPGDYTVTLTVTNVCTTTSKSQTFNLTFVGTQELAEISNIRILPNPTAADFRVEMNSLLTTNIRLQLLDAQGRLIRNVKATTIPGVTTVPFAGLHLDKGMYQLKVQTESGVLAFSVVVQ